MKSFIILVAAMLAAPALIAQDAQPQPPPQRTARPNAMTPELIKKYDKDGDGQLNAEEHQAMRTELRQERQAADLKKYDKDGDGKLNEEEMAARNADRNADRERLRNAMGDRPAVRGNRADSSRVRGELPGRERPDSARFGGPEGRAPGGALGFGSREEIMKKYDKDGDGKLNDEERAAMRADIEKMRGERGAPDTARMRGGRQGGPGGDAVGQGGRRGTRGEGMNQGGRRGNRDNADGQQRGRRGNRGGDAPQGGTPPPPPPADGK